MRFVVEVRTCAEDEGELIGPFPDKKWAERYIERMANRGFIMMKLVPLQSAVLLGLDKDSYGYVVFDPDREIDR